jgi:hypothetical protein
LHEREQCLRDNLAQEQLPGARVNPDAWNQTAWKLYRKGDFGFAHRDWLFQPLGLLEIAIRLPWGDRTLSRQAHNGWRKLVELAHQLASAIETFGFLGVAGARHMS